MINAKFEEKGMDCRIDHRSYVDPGIGFDSDGQENSPCSQDGEKVSAPRGVEPLDQSYQSYDSQYASYRAALKEWIEETKEILKEPKEIILYSCSAMLIPCVTKRQ